MTKLSVLNLVPVREGQSNAEAIGAMIRLAQETEKLGYERYWIAEHHNTANLVSSATQILIGHTLTHTQKIRVGSGGVMLPNHTPLIVAEQYGTLATIYPNRVDLGLGRAPGTDMHTAAALRRSEKDVSLHFPDDVRALQRYLGDLSQQGDVKAYPGMGLELPLYILGSSTESAFLAAELGLPYVFASHFAPRMMEMAVEIYRQQFKPSKVLDKPYVIICLNVIAAETQAEAESLATTQQQFFLNVVRGTQQFLQPPVADMDKIWTPSERLMAERMLDCSLVGDIGKIRQEYHRLQAKVNADELMVVSYIFDEQKQFDSYRLFKQMIEKENQQ